MYINIDYFYTNVVYQSAQVAIIKHHRQSGLSNRNVNDSSRT